MTGDVSIPLDLTLFLIGQTVALVGAVLAAYLGLSKKVSEISIHVEHLSSNASADRSSHQSLRDQVQGISRTVERHDAVMQVNTVSAAKRAEDLVQKLAEAAHREQQDPLR